LTIQPHWARRHSTRPHPVPMPPAHRQKTLLGNQQPWDHPHGALYRSLWDKHGNRPHGQSAGPYTLLVLRNQHPVDRKEVSILELSWREGKWVRGVGLIK